MTSLFSQKIKTKNINATISKFASENALLESKLYFNINAVYTYIKTTSDNEFKLYKDDPFHYYTDVNKIINEHVRFKQIYAHIFV